MEAKELIETLCAGFILGYSSCVCTILIIVWNITTKFDVKIIRSKEKKDG